MTAERKKTLIDRILVPILSGLLSCSVALGVVFTTGMMEYAVDQNEQKQIQKDVSTLQDITTAHSRRIEENTRSNAVTDERYTQLERNQRRILEILERRYGGAR